MPGECFHLSRVGTDFCLAQGSLPKLTADCQLKKYFGLKKTLHHTCTGHGSPCRQCPLPRCQLSQGTHQLRRFPLGENGTQAAQIIEISSYVRQREHELSRESLCSRTWTKLRLPRARKSLLRRKLSLTLKAESHFRKWSKSHHPSISPCDGKKLIPLY